MRRGFASGCGHPQGAFWGDRPPRCRGTTRKVGRYAPFCSAFPGKSPFQGGRLTDGSRFGWKGEAEARMLGRPSATDAGEARLLPGVSPAGRAADPVDGERIAAGLGDALAPGPPRGATATRHRGGVGGPHGPAARARRTGRTGRTDGRVGAIRTRTRSRQPTREGRPSRKPQCAGSRTAETVRWDGTRAHRGRACTGRTRG